MILKLFKKFSQFWGDLSKKSNFVISSFMYAYDSSHYTPSENFIVIMLWLTVLNILAFEVEQFCWGLHNITKNVHYFWQLKDHNSEKKYGN